MKTPDEWADAAWEWFDPKSELLGKTVELSGDTFDQLSDLVKDVVRETVKLALQEFAAELKDKCHDWGDPIFKVLLKRNIDALLKGETSDDVYGEKRSDSWGDKSGWE